MCGLVGYIDTRDKRQPSKELLIRMANTIRHRGPDSSGYFIGDGVGLGFRRLSIIGLKGGDQPIYNEDRSLVLLCNGEIYNYKELTRELEQKGHVFRTKSDVEVLAHLYEEHGAELLQKLNGQFAFVIYDRRDNTIFLARDHFGINQLYYTIVDGVLIFASEIKAILEHPLVCREVDLTGLDQMLSFPGIVSPRAMFKGVKSLKSGHYIIAKGEGVKVVEYWDLDYPKSGEIEYDGQESYYVEKLSELFAQSVKLRLQADVPVGFYLSGGLDSSLMGAMISRVSPDRKTHSLKNNGVKVVL